MFEGDVIMLFWVDVICEWGIMVYRLYVGLDGCLLMGWYVEFVDFNNDGLDDIFVVKGNVE